MGKISRDYRFFQSNINLLSEAMIGVPQRVPVFAQIHEFAMKETGFTPTTFYNNSENLVYGLLETHRRYHIDAPCLDYDVYNIEAEALGQKLIFTDESIPDVDRLHPLIKTKGDIRKIKRPNFSKDGRFPFVVRSLELFKEYTEMTSALNFCAPFSLAANIRGMETLIFDMIDDPNFTHELFKRITDEVLIPWILYQYERFPDTPSIVGSDATASIPIVSIEMLEEWVIPYIQRIRETCGSKVYVSNWVGERYIKNPKKMFSAKLKVCPGFLEGQDPDIEALGPEVYKEYAENHDVALILGVGTAFLANVSPLQVKTRVKQYLETGKRGGRFALYLCNIGKTTPPENLRAAVEAVHEYGRY